MIEFFPGTSIYWYPANKSCVKASSKNATQLCSSCVDVFFSRDTLRCSNVKGGGIRQYKKLDPRIIAAIICKYKCITL